MGFFGRNKKQNATAKKASTPVEAVVPTPTSGTARSDIGRVLRNPRITEKATNVQARSVYTFDIAPGVSKREIMEAVRALYHVTPRKVGIVRIPTKTRRNMKTGIRGITRGGRKAYVYLKAGETITIH